MATNPFALLYGDSNWVTEPWFQYDCTVAKEVSHDALTFLHATFGLHGDFHDQHGWLVDMDSWAALKMYVQTCVDNNECFELHLTKVADHDAFYVVLATSRTEEFHSKVKDVK